MQPFVVGCVDHSCNLIRCCVSQPFAGVLWCEAAGQARRSPPASRILDLHRGNPKERHCLKYRAEASSAASFPSPLSLPCRHPSWLLLSLAATCPISPSPVPTTLLPCPRHSPSTSRPSTCKWQRRGRGRSVRPGVRDHRLGERYMHSSPH